MVAQGIPEIGSYIAFLFVSTVALVIVLRLFITPKDLRPTPEKRKPFESGQIAAGPGRTRFIIQYYPYLLMFVVYDVVAMFLFAWGFDLRSDHTSRFSSSRPSLSSSFSGSSLPLRTFDLLLKRGSHSNQAKSLPALAGLDSSSSTIPTC